MAMRIVIIGAVALGPKVACRLRRLDPEAEITLLDRDNLISYGGCGIPYYVGGDINNLEDLYSTSANIVRDELFFEDCKGIKVKTRVEALSIDKKQKSVTVKHLRDGHVEKLEYDKLVLATGAKPNMPNFPGCQLENVYVLSNLHEAEQVKKLLATGKISRAVVIGGGAIGVEIGEAMTDLWGIDTCLIEVEDQILPTLFGKCISRVVKSHMESKGVEVILEEKVQRIFVDEKTKFYTVETTQKAIATDIVILATGVKPNSKLAANAELALGNSGGILVDRRMRTSDPNIYAGGDCVELRNLVSGENTLMSLGSLANRQGRIIAENIHGGNSHFDGTVGTFCMKVFDLGVAKAGLTYRQAKETGFDPIYAVVSQADHAHFYPNAEMLYLSLIADKKSRKILGIEATGKHGDAVKARVDTVAVLLKHGITVDDICDIEAGYAPPFASAMDVLNNAGNTLDNILAGLNSPVDVYDFLSEFRLGTSKVLDTRATESAAPFIQKYGSQWLNIPQNELRKRYMEIPKDERLFLVCDTGLRSYETQVFLTSKGIVKTRNVQGGFAMVKMTDPSFI